MEISISAPYEKQLKFDLKDDVTVEELTREISDAIKIPTHTIQLFHEDIPLKPEMTIEKASDLKVTAKINLDIPPPVSDSKIVSDDSFKRNTAFLTDMYFSPTNVENALIASKNDVEVAISYLLAQPITKITESSSRSDEDAIRLYDGESSNDSSQENSNEISPESPNTSDSDKTIPHPSETALQVVNYPKPNQDSIYLSMKQHILSVLKSQSQIDDEDNDKEHEWTPEEDKKLTTLYEENVMKDNKWTTLQEAFPDIKLYEIRIRIMQLSLDNLSSRSKNKGITESDKTKAQIVEKPPETTFKFTEEDMRFFWKLILHRGTPFEKMDYMKDRYKTHTEEELKTMYMDAYNIIMFKSKHFQALKYSDFMTVSQIPEELLMQVYLSIYEVKNKWSCYKKIFPNVDAISLKQRVKKLLKIEKTDQQLQEKRDTSGDKRKEHWPREREQQFINMMATNKRDWQQILQVNPNYNQHTLIMRFYRLIKAYREVSRPDLVFPKSYLEKIETRGLGKKPNSSSEEANSTKSADEENKTNENKSEENQALDEMTNLDFGFIEENQMKFTTSKKILLPQIANLNSPDTDPNLSAKQRWSPQEDNKLLRVYDRYKNERDKWLKILWFFPTRTSGSLINRLNRLRHGLIKPKKQLNENGEEITKNEEEEEESEEQKVDQELPVIVDDKDQPTPEIEKPKSQEIEEEVTKQSDIVNMGIIPIEKEELIVKYLKKINKYSKNDSLWDEKNDQLLLKKYVKGEDIYEEFSSVSKIAISSRLRYLKKILSNPISSEEAHVWLSDKDRKKIGLPVFNFKMKELEEERPIQMKFYDLSEIVAD